MKKVLLGLVLALFPVVCAASSAGVTSVFDIGTSVRAQSMGGAFSAFTGDSAGGYFNPALLDTVEKTEIQAAYIPLFFDTTYNYICAAIPTLDIGSFGFSGAVINTGNIAFRNDDGVKTGDSSQFIMELIAGWGKFFITPDLSVGLNLKLDYQSITHYANDLTFGLDLGSFYRVISDKDQMLGAALVLKNTVEPDFKLSGTADTVPRQLIAGASYKRILTADITGTANMDLVAPIGTDFDLKAGMEFTFFKIVAIRAGYNTYGILSAGAGLTLFDSITLDYGLFLTELDTQNRFALKYVFGDDIPDMRKRKAEIDQEKIEKMAKVLAAKELEQLRGNIDKMKDKERFKALHYSNGLESYFDGDLKRSLAEFQTVYDIDSGYMSVTYYTSYIKGLMDRSKQGAYSDEVVKLYREGVELYLKQDYKGAKAKWESILKIDPYNRLAIENLKEVNPLLRELEGFKEGK